MRQTIERIYREESRRVFASLVRLLRDFDVAEEALHEAYLAAAERWPDEGLPANPRAWLVSVGRFKAIDALRRKGRFEEIKHELAQRIDDVAQHNSPAPAEEIEDDRLRLIFACCHPAIDPKVQAPLTLREVCGLTTEEIASAFLTAPSTMAQRIVRGKAKIRDAGIPFAMPAAEDFAERLDSVLTVIYLVFNEGYSASSGESLMRGDISAEAIRLGRLLVHLCPDPETMGLLALMLLQESRRGARTTETGDILLLEEQNRALWDSALIAEGVSLVEQAISTRQFGAYTLQAAIAAEHARATAADSTDWNRIVNLYNALSSIHPSPVIELNKAVAVAMRDGPQAGLTLINAILERGELTTYHLAHAAKADLCRRLGRFAEAKASYSRALELAKQGAEKRFLEKRLRELSEA